MASQQKKLTDENGIRDYLLKQLPVIIEEEPEIRRVIVRVSQNRFADKDKTEERFDRMFEELKKDREENNKKWEESNKSWNEKWEENNKKWEENNRRWEENNKNIQETNKELKEYIQKSDEKFSAIMEEIRDIRNRHEQTLGALGSRWGAAAESSFRKALKAILENRFDVQVLNVTEYDHEGFVFGHPDQVEIDIIVKNGELIICEIKSSMSRSDMYTFSRKIEFYEKNHNCKATSKMVISPMADQKAIAVAEKFGIEVYTFAEDVKLS